METHQKQFIKDNLPKLVKSTNCTEKLLGVLLERQYLAQKDIDHLNLFKHKQVQAAVLYKLLQDNGLTFDDLQDVMEKAEQPEACSILGECEVTNIFRHRSISYKRSLHVGAGYYGSNVYHGKYNAMDVAVKKIYHDNKTGRSLVERQVEILVKSEPHDRVVRYFKAECSADFTLIAMEPLAANLDHWIGKQASEYPFKPLDLLSQIADAVAHLHSKGIIHGNLHPANILTSLSGDTNISVRLSDFGMISTIKGDGNRRDMFLSGFGTGKWTAPEVIRYVRGDGVTLDNSADIFSLGCLFYYFLTGGKHPFVDGISQMGNILKGEVTLCESDFTLINAGTFGFIWLIRQMVSSRQVERPPAQAILSHPVFWPHAKIAQFLNDVLPFAENHSALLDNCAGFVTRNGAELGRVHGDSDIVREYLSPKSFPSVINLSSLLKVIHEVEELHLPEEVVDQIKTDHPQFWLAQFPHLLPVTWTVLQIENDSSLIQKYYGNDWGPFKFNLVRKSGNMFELFPLPQLDSEESRRAFLGFAKAVFNSKLNEKIPLENQGGNSSSFYDDAVIQEEFSRVISEILKDIEQLLSGQSTYNNTSIKESFQEFGKTTLDSYLTKNNEHRAKAEEFMDSFVEGLLSSMRGELEDHFSHNRLEEDEATLKQVFQKCESAKLRSFQLAKQSYGIDFYNKYLVLLENKMTSIYQELKDERQQQMPHIPESFLEDAINEYELELAKTARDGHGISEAALRMIHSIKMESVIDKLEHSHPGSHNILDMKDKLQGRMQKIFDRMMTFVAPPRPNYEVLSAEWDHEKYDKVKTDKFKSSGHPKLASYSPSPLMDYQEEGLSLSRIIRTIESSISVRILHDTWPILARHLEVSAATIKKIRHNLLLDKITQSEALHELIEFWYTEFGSHATPQKLIKAFEDSGINSIGEALRLEFNFPCKGSENTPLSWEYIGSNFQRKVVSSLNTFYPSIEFDKQSQSKLTREELIDLMTGKEPSLVTSIIPETIRYYVPRTLITRNRLTEKLFESSTDTFLFNGIERSVLSRLIMSNKSIYQRTDTTASQLNNRDPDVRYIILDMPSHFYKFEASSASSVHHIEFMDNSFYWVKSVGSLDNLRRFIDKSQNILSEMEFLDNICSFSASNLPVCISDSPGMGKSMILTHVARMLKNCLPERIVIFLQFAELIHYIEAKNYGGNDLMMTIQLALQTLTCKSELESRILHSKFESETVTIELMLDGYDELSAESLKTANAVLKQIHPALKSIRLWVTTRPHLLQNLENMFAVLGYTIQPFTPEDQANFLTSYWSRDQHLPLNENKLSQFATRCLEQFKSTLSSKEEDIAGIPLQCYLIGEVYEEDAIEYSHGDARFFSINIRATSITDLYKFTIQKKLQKYHSIQSREYLSSENIINMHFHLALKLLFPAYFERVKSKFSPVMIDNVLKIGILESRGSESEMKFIHKTFAEYFVSLFVVYVISGKFSPDGSDNDNYKANMAALPMLEIFACKQSLQIHEFKYPIICFFINSLLSGREVEAKIAQTFVGRFKSEQEIKKLVGACVNSDFINIFNLFDRINALERYGKEIFNEALILQALEKSSVGLIKKTIDRYESLHQFDINFMTRALRVAVKRGEFTPVEFLLREKKLDKIITDKENREGMQLLHCCVQNSKENSEQIIRQKIEVVQFLVQINPLLLREKNQEGSTPLLCQNIHILLLRRLIELGSDVLARNARNDTILHLTYFTPEEYRDVLTYIPMESIVKLVNVIGYAQDTPLLRLIKTMDPEQETFDIFKDAGADFNTCHKYRTFPLLAIAITEGRNMSTLRKLIECGSSVGWKGKEEGSLLHVAAKCGNLSAISVLLEYGVNINAVDGSLDTALHIGAKLNDIADSLKVIKIIIECGGNAGARNLQGNTFLHELLYSRNRITSSEFHEVIRLLIQLNCIDILEVENRLGSYALMVALNNLDVDEETLSMLLKHDVNLLKSATGGRKGVHAANMTGYRNYVKTMKFLIENGAKVDATIDDDTFLHILLRRFADMSADEFHEIVRFLVKNDHTKLFNIRGKNGETPLHYAVEMLYAKEDTISFLSMSGVKFDSVDDNGDSVLTYAIRAKKSGDFIKKLVRYGANASQINAKGHNLLHIAAKHHNADAMEFIIQLGLNVDGIDRNGDTPLHLCFDREGQDWSRSSCRQITRLLLGHGASVTQTNMKNESPLSIAKERFHDDVELLQVLPNRLAEQSKGGNSELHKAVSSDDFMNVTELIKRGTKVNGQNRKLETPLHLASSIKDKNHALKIIQFLIDNKADPSMKDEKDQTFLHILLATNTNLSPTQFHDLAEYLIGKGHTKSLDIAGCNDGTTPIHLALLNLNVEGETLTLLSSLVDWNQTNHVGRTPLFFATCSTGNSHLLPQLVQLGADYELVDKSGNNLVHVAAEYGNVDGMKYFISLGLNVNGTNSSGNNPLHVALLMGRRNIPEIISILAEAGADSHQKNNMGVTPFNILTKKITTDDQIKIVDDKKVKLSCSEPD